MSQIVSHYEEHYFPQLSIETFCKILHITETMGHFSQVPVNGALTHFSPQFLNDRWHFVQMGYFRIQNKEFYRTVLKMGVLLQKFHDVIFGTPVAPSNIVIFENVRKIKSKSIGLGFFFL